MWLQDILREQLPLIFVNARTAAIVSLFNIPMRQAPLMRHARFTILFCAVLPLTCPLPSPAADTEHKALDFRSTTRVYGTDTSHLSKNAPSAQAPASGGAVTALARRRQRHREAGIIATTAGAFTVYGLHNWWNDGFAGQFRTVSEGWFGPDTYAGGIDKLGHIYTAYVGTRLLTDAFRWAGNKPDRALKLAVLTMVGVLEGTEIVDGYSKQERFSREDFIANLLGAGMGVLFERHPRVDRLLDFRLHYWRSAEARRINMHDPVSDFSGQTYLLVVKAEGVPAFRRRPLLRYLEFAVGYGVSGYDEPAVNPADRSRQLYFGISLNLSAILHATVYASHKGRGRAERVTDTLLEYIQIPNTATLSEKTL